MTAEPIKRIALVCTGFPIPTETFVLNQVAGFIRQGIQVDIFPYKKWPSLPGAYEELNLEKQVFESAIPPQHYGKRLLGAVGLLWQHRKHFFRLIKTLNCFVLGKSAPDLTVFYGAIPFLGKPGYQLILAHFGENGIGMEKMLCCGFIKAPLITIFHGYDIHWQPGGLQQKIAGYRHLFKNGHAFVANGNYGLGQLKTLGAPPEKCFIIPAGLDAEAFKNTGKEEPTITRFCSVGRLMQLKGHHLALEALTILHKKGFTQWEYVIAGTGEQMEALEKQAAQAGIGQLVKLPGYLGTQQVKALMAQSSIFIHPSVTDASGRAETQGLAIQEAQAMGLPVVAFDSGGIRFGVPEGSGILVPEGKVEALAAALETLVNDASLRKTMGEKAKQWALENYDVMKLNQQILHVAEIT